MTNTKFRKRALLSSVAMLLVALVALGSATFAWFSTTNTAKAGSFSAKTAKSSNILLSETGNSGWTNDLTFTQNTALGTTNGGTNLKPVTTKDFTNWYAKMADDYNYGYSTDSYTGPIADIKTAGDYVKYTTLYIQSVGADKSLKLDCKVTYPETTTTGVDYLRVALVPKTGGYTTDNFAAAESGSKNILFANLHDDYANATNGWTSGTQSSDPLGDATGFAKGTFGTQITLGAADADEIYGYDVYVYYEGNDPQCKDMYAGTNLKVDFEVEAV